MFGFLRPTCGDVTYRQIYARGCQSLRRFGGLKSLPTLSFEAVFLQTLLTDIGWCEAPPQEAPQCCRLRRRTECVSAQTDVIEEFCAAFGMLLVSVKLDDDIADEHSWRARLLKWTLAAPLARSYEFFRRLDPQFDAVLQQIMLDQAALEASDAVVEWDVYRAPTSRAFGYLFGLASKIAPQQDRNETSAATDGEWLNRIGQEVGSAILAFDCAVDWETDQRRHRFNPLRSRDEAETMLAQAQLHIAKAVWKIEERIAGPSTSWRVMHAAFNRIRATALPWQRRANQRRLLERWGLRRDPGYTYAKCDCACEGLCAGLECLGGCGEGAACGAEGCTAFEGCGGGCGRCGCEMCCCDGCVGGCGDKSNQKKAASKTSNDSDNEFSHLVGQTGRAKTALSPMGLVEIDGQAFPAESEMGYIEINSPVSVVGSRSIGVIVRESDYADPVIALDSIDASIGTRSVESAIFLALRGYEFL